MKVAVVLLSCVALVSCSRRYPGGGSGGSQIIFPGGQSHVPFPSHPGGIVGGSGFPSPIGHGGESLYLDACRTQNSLIHDSFKGHNYHFSWCRDGGQLYTWQGARDYCRALGKGWYPVDVESRDEDTFIIDIVGTHRSPWIWTGGNRLNRNDFVFEWLNGNPITYSNWGQTGSNNVEQPDNAENNNERCLAYLNQFYRGDLITWHDIGCDHLKPTICEYSNGGQVTQPQYG